MNTQHSSLDSALLTIENLISQGHSSFKLYRSEKVWNVIINAVHTNS